MLRRSHDRAPRPSFPALRHLICVGEAVQEVLRCHAISGRIQEARGKLGTRQHRARHISMLRNNGISLHNSPAGRASTMDVTAVASLALGRPLGCPDEGLEHVQRGHLRPGERRRLGSPAHAISTSLPMRPKAEWRARRTRPAGLLAPRTFSPKTLSPLPLGRCVPRSLTAACTAPHLRGTGVGERPRPHLLLAEPGKTLLQRLLQRGKLLRAERHSRIPRLQDEAPVPLEVTGIRERSKRAEEDAESLCTRRAERWVTTLPMRGWGAAVDGRQAL